MKFQTVLVLAVAHTPLCVAAQSAAPTAPLASAAASGASRPSARPQPNANALPPPVSAVPGFVPSSIPGMIRIDNKAYFYSPSKWKSPVIPVCWEKGNTSATERGWVEQSVKASWGDNSALRFLFTSVPCADNAKGIRIAVRDVSATDGPHTIGLGNYLDGKPAGMVLNFTFQTWGASCLQSEARREACIRSIAVHEFGHALGFAHEQNRPDTPGECAQPAQGPNGDLMLTPWEKESVMNYCNPIYNNDGKLSAGDVIGVVSQYGKKP